MTRHSSTGAVARVLRVGTCADGVRGAERALGHVIAAAQLCTLCCEGGGSSRRGAVANTA